MVDVVVMQPRLFGLGSGKSCGFGGYTTSDMVPCRLLSLLIYAYAASSSSFGSTLKISPRT
jgi:hypothetical protein